MSENLLVGTHRYTDRKYRDNYELTFQKQQLDCEQCICFMCEDEPCEEGCFECSGPLRNCILQEEEG